MHLQETDEQQAFRARVRAYFGELLSPQIRSELGGDESTSAAARKAICRRMGADGWLGVGWPTAYGGQGRSTAEQFIFVDESKRADAPLPFVTLNTVGPTLIAHGSEDQKKEYLPGILAGEVTFAIGYTEPDAGTDLASLRTRADIDGDEFVINGQKIFTTGAHEADYVWLACRTDQEAKKHKGISIIIVPTSTDGFSVSPIITIAGHRTNASYYDDVRVSRSSLVGDLHGGWSLITSQLNHERVGLGALSVEAVEMYDQVCSWAAQTPAEPANGDTLLDLGWVQTDLALCRAKLDAMSLLNWQMVQRVEEGTLVGHQASVAKVYGTETAVEIYNLLLGIVGAAGRLRPGTPSAALHGRLEQCGRAGQINTFGGGVNEIGRDMISWMRLGLTRPGR